MNILHYVESTDSRMGGVPRFVLDASRVMAAQGHRSRILTLDTTDTPEAWLADHDGSSLPTVTKLPRPALMGKLFGPAQLREIRSHLAKADAVHLHCVWSVSTLQIAAAHPSVVSRDQFDPSLVASEREIYRAQVQGKPENIVEKIVDGKMDKFFSTACLLEQACIKNPDITVKDLLLSKEKETGDRISISRFVRYALGEESGEAPPEETV